MKRAAIRKAESRPRVVFRSDSAEGGSKTSPSAEEIRRRAFEIYRERGAIHGRDLDDWLQAERELQGTQPPPGHCQLGPLILGGENEY